jgi:hypothetical protein
VRRRALGAAVIGNVLEWYDFAVYAFLATVLARKFFPSGDELSALLATFAVFGVGFVVRPLGGVIIGRLGDRRGRKIALSLTIVLMALGTVMIGLLPSYESIGVGATALLVAARLLQGFSAGGEWGSSTAFIVEWAPPKRRGLFGSLQQASVAGGFLLGSLTAASLSTWLGPAALEAWGWRVPFLFGGLLGPIGLYMRRNIEETPPFKAAMQAWHRDRAAWLAPGGARVRFHCVVDDCVLHFLELHADLPAKARRAGSHAGAVVEHACAAGIGGCGAGGGRAVRSHRTQALAARLVCGVSAADLSVVCDVIVEPIAAGCNCRASGVRTGNCSFFRPRTGGDCRDLPYAHALDLDVDRL